MLDVEVVINVVRTDTNERGAITVSEVQEDASLHSIRRLAAECATRCEAALGAHAPLGEDDSS